MSLWNLGGMNPKFKDFVEQYPDKTMMGMGWSLYWRWMVLILAVEIGLALSLLVIGLLLRVIF